MYCPFDLEKDGSLTCALNTCVYDDALHYLKEYRERKENYKDAAERHHAAYRILEDRMKWKAVQLFDDNPPLTWDELKQMEGKPVWVEPSGADGYWIIPYMFSETGGAEYCFAQGDQYWKEYMRDRDDGISWQAYRKERK